MNYFAHLQDLKPTQKIALVGVGTENLQFLAWLINVVKINKSQIVLLDKQDTGLTAANITYNYNFSGYCGDSYLAPLLQDSTIEYVFKAPGIWSLTPEFEAFRAKKGTDRVASPLLFFFERYREQIISVTGTKGKTTTSLLLTHIINSASQNTTTAHYCGNTSNISPYSFWTDINQPIVKNEYFVVEVSSFQLQDLGYSEISSQYAILTNLYIDHLDQHKDVQEYWLAKSNIYRHQKSSDVCVMTAETRGKVTSLANPTSQVITLDTLESQSIASRLQSPLLGIHNASNLALAYTVAQKIDPTINDQLTILALQNFTNSPHRLQKVHSITRNQLTINFYDDGAATEPDAVIACLDALTQQPNEKIWLWITGKDKGIDVAELCNRIIGKQDRCVAVSCCGEVGEKVYEYLTKETEDLAHFYDNFKPTFAFKIADYLETISEYNNKEFATLNIVLSPCGSSFDEFKNYIERSDFFVENVKKFS